MTANHEHMPTTVRVRLAATSPNEKFSLKGTDFDRWLAARDARITAAAEQRGAIKALRDAAKDWRWSEWSDAPRSPIAVANYVGDWLTDRADQIADQGGDDE